MAAQVFWAVFYSSWRPSQIGPTADFDGAATPPPICSMLWYIWFFRGWSGQKVYNACCSAQLTHNQFKPVQQSRQQVQRAYCLIYIMWPTSSKVVFDAVFICLLTNLFMSGNGLSELIYITQICLLLALDAWSASELLLVSTVGLNSKK